MKKWLVIVGCPLAILSGMVFAAQNQAEQMPGAVIPQPEHWVAFTADYQVTDKASGAVRVGRIYRRADGSTREEETGPSHTGVAINNVKQSVRYVFRSGQVAVKTGGKPYWTSQPMILPHDGYMPPVYREGVTGLTRLTDSVQGFEAYRIDKPNGGFEIKAPQLNFFSIVRYSAPLDQHYEYFGITLGDPPDRIFEPPPGTSVERLDRPGGIVTTYQK